MDRARWRDRLGPPSVMLGTALLLSAALPASQASLTVHAAGRAPVAAGCPVDPSTAAQAAQRPRGRGEAIIEARLTAGGEFIGRAISVRSAPGPVSTLSLSAESFVGQQVGDSVLYTSHDVTTGSVVGLIDLASGCVTNLATPGEIVRSATLDPASSSVYVHSVTPGSRADAGVQRIDLATGEVVLVVPPLPVSEAFGPIFATELRWSIDGSALAVQSCGLEACRTRVLDITSGAITTFDAPGQGDLVGLTSAHLVTYAACHGLPCAVLSTDLATGASTVLAEAVVGASIAPYQDGRGVVTLETAAGVTEVLQ